MRLTRLLLLPLAAGLLLLPAQGMNNADLIKMKEAGISEDTIVYAMGVHPAEYDASPEALIALKKAGLSEIIILKLISLQSPAKRPPVPEEAPKAGGAPKQDAVPKQAVSPEPAAPAPAVAAPRPKAARTDPPAAQAPASAPPRAPRTALRSSATDMPAPPSSGVRAAGDDIGPAAVAPPFIYPAVGGDYFTRFSFRYERGRHLTTNYSRGKLVPINTPVKLVSLTDDEFELQRLDTRDRFRVKNVEKRSGKPLIEVARLMLAAEKTPLERLPAEVADAIREGELREGMTKEQVLMARGYPPEHRTPSINADEWVFWSSRFIHHTLTFENGRLRDGRGVEGVD